MDDNPAIARGNSVQGCGFIGLPWHIAEKVATNIEQQNPRRNGAKEPKKTGFQSPSELLRLEAWRMN